MKRDIVVIGASAGGIEALRILMAGLPAGFPATFFVVVHTSPNSPGVLASILEGAGALPAFMVKDRERSQRGCIYVPCPDHHLIVEMGHVRGSRGPRENRFRPAVDPLFRTAAYTYDSRVIGIVLSGGLDDGSAGLWAVKQQGGVAIVQDPSDAIVSSMPLNAMRYVNVDHCVPVAQMPSLLHQLVQEPVEGGLPVPKQLKTEVDIARELKPLEAGITELGEPSLYACPECHGVLLEVKDGKNSRFRCHTGHAFSVNALLSDMDGRIEEALWNANRALQEKAMLLRHLAEHEEAREGGFGKELLERAEDTERRSEVLRRATFEQIDAAQPHIDQEAA